MGFQNEKDHPEVAPSQFEMNYSYAEVVAAADQVQLYKLICRQVANKMGLTASFLPKPVAGVNGSGMHTNMSISKNGKNLFCDPKGEEKLSKFGWEFVDRILTNGNDICLMLNPSVNAYRRLDPHFEAPNQIKASAIDRGSMVRIPIGNERSMRVEVRSVAPDANPYMVMLSLFKTGPRGRHREDQEPAPGRTLPARQHLRRAGQLQRGGMDHQAAGRGREGPLRRPEAGLGRPLPAPAGHLRQGAGSAVPPRGLQPVPLEHVLDGMRSYAIACSGMALMLAGFPGDSSIGGLSPGSALPGIAAFPSAEPDFTGVTAARPRGRPFSEWATSAPNPRPLKSSASRAEATNSDRIGN